VAPEELDKTRASAETSPIIEPGHTFASITDKISAIVLTRPTTRFWYIGFGIAFVLVMLLFYAIAAVITIGVGLFGINIPVAWGFDLFNSVWWFGSGPAGPFISPSLRLGRQRWRNRSTASPRR